MTKINKSLTEDVFKGMKHVDEAFNKAAGINESVAEPFEATLKKRLLKENMNYENTNVSDVVEEASDADPRYAFLDTPEEEMDNTRNWEDEELASEDELDETLNEYGNEHPMSVNAALGEENSELDEVLFNESTMTEDNPFSSDEETSEVNAEEMPATDDEVGTEEIPGMEDTEVDMTSGGGALPTDDGMEDTSTEEVPAAPSTTLSQPEDIDQLIADIVPPSDENTITENKELKDLGYKELETQELTNKVKMENARRTKAVIENSTESKPLENKYGTPSKINGAIDGKKAEHTVQPEATAQEELGYVPLGEEEIDANTVKPGSATKVETNPKFAKIVAESTKKTKALNILAERYCLLEDQMVALQLENYKLKSANSVLVLLPEASELTRTKLVQRFTECKTNKEVKAFYEEVASMAKAESTKTKKLNEVATRRSSSIKAIKENVTTSEENEESSSEQERKNFLMGIGNDDMYNQFETK